VVSEHSKEKAVFVLSSSEANEDLFPHEFELEVVVQVSDENGGTLSQTVRYTHFHSCLASVQIYIRL
jgi:hypothetical protein